MNHSLVSVAKHDDLCFSLCVSNCLLSCSCFFVSFSTGIFNVPIDVIVKAAYLALEKFDDIVSSKQRYLKDIYFISNDAKVVADMIGTFQMLAKK